MLLNAARDLLQVSEDLSEETWTAIVTGAWPHDRISIAYIGVARVKPHSSKAFLQCVAGSG